MNMMDHEKHMVSLSSSLDNYEGEGKRNDDGLTLSG